jgi:hypothetical protein
MDKLQRSTLDALVNAGAIEDDARVVAIRAAKVFPGDSPEALDVPGARIRVEAVDDTSAENRCGENAAGKFAEGRLRCRG